MPLYDYQCSKCNNITEGFGKIADKDETIPCSACGKPSKRIISPVRAKLDPNQFPGEKSRWIKKRENHMKFEKKLADNHGEDALWR